MNTDFTGWIPVKARPRLPLSSSGVAPKDRRLLVQVGDFAIRRGRFGFDLIQVCAVTVNQVRYRFVEMGAATGRERRTDKYDIIFSNADVDECKSRLSKLLSARGERNRREREAEAWFRKRVAEICQ